MPSEKPTAVEIDRKLRDDFRRRLRDFGVSAEATDPVLAVLFRTLGGQLEELYSASDRIRLALLDELVSGLGIDARRARAAQTVVRFLTSGNPQLVEAGAELIGSAEPSADAETISLAAAALQAVGVRDVSVDINLPTLVPSLCDALGLEPAVAQRLRAALDRKDIAEVESVGGAVECVRAGGRRDVGAGRTGSAAGCHR